MSTSDDEKWTWISTDGEIQDESISVDNPESLSEDGLEMSSVSDGQQDDDIADDEVESDSSSDIERIDEPNLMIESFNAELPDFNIETQCDNEETELEDDEKNKQLVPVDNNNLVNVVIDHFRHNRESKFKNFLRSVVVMLVIALSVFLVIGIYSQRLQMNQIDENPMNYLKKMQGENDEVLNNLQRKLDENKDDASSILCYRKVKYWKQQYDDLLSENQDLQKILNDENAVKTQCDKNLESEQEKLKLSLIHTQDEFDEAVKQFELIQKEEQLNREKMNLLKEENDVLRSKLQVENDLDEGDEKLLHFLMKENVKFRMQLESAKKTAISSEQTIQPEVDTLRQKINQLHLENEDLRQVIARLRYGRPYESTDKQTTIEQLQTENGELKMEIGKIKMSNAEEQQSKMAMIKDGGISPPPFSEADVFREVLENVYDDNNLTSNSNWSLAKLFARSRTRKAYRKLRGTIVDVFKDVVSKTNHTIFEVWSSGIGVKLRNTTTHFLVEVEKTWTDSGNVLKATTSKVLDAVNAIDVKKTKKVVKNFVKKLWKFVGNLKEKKNVIHQEPKNGKPKHDGRRSVDFDNDHVGKDGDEEKANWMFSRARFREERHGRQRQADWLFDRARDRKEQHEKQIQADWLFDRARDRREQRKKKGDRGEDLNDINWFLRKNKRTNIKGKIKKNRRYNQNKEERSESSRFERRSSRDGLRDRKKTLSRENWRFFDDFDEDESCRSKIRPCEIRENVDQETLFGHR